MLATLVLAAAATLPSVIADPRLGPSPWAVVRQGDPLPEAGAAGYLIELPERPQQGDLERVVALAAGGVPVVSITAAPPAEPLRPYLDAFALDPPPPPEALPALRAAAGGVAVVLPAGDPAAAVALLAGGAASVLVRGEPAWAGEVAELLPEPQPARAGELPLATALRGGDLATVVGLPDGFPGGEVRFSGAWYEKAYLAGEPPAPLPLAARGEDVAVRVPPLPGGGVVVALRPGAGEVPVEVVEVKGERLPTAAEVLARHQRAAARQERLFSRFAAEQRLLLRVNIVELARSFEVVLAGPAFFERGAGTDWEITRAWLDGVAWHPDHLPKLPLLEPKRPQVEALAVRLEPGWHYELDGVKECASRQCFVLSFTSAVGAGGERRSGTAWIDRASFALVAREERAEGLPDEVRATVATTTYAPHELDGEAVWLPERVVADDLVVVFGGAATVHRELTLSEIAIEPPGFAGERAAAWAREHRMLRDDGVALRPLVPDGRGGRVVGEETRPAQRFLIAGGVYDPGLDYPVPFGGLELHDFRFRNRDMQVRALIAGVVNDATVSGRRGRFELTARGFVQLLPFASTVRVRGEEQNGEALELRRQRVGVGAALAAGPARVALELGLDRLDFDRDDDTDPAFVVPSDTWEGIARLETTLALGATTVSLAGETGRRERWEPWGYPNGEPPLRSWRRMRLLLTHERTPFPLARLHLDAELVGGDRVDRFSAPAPARFGAVRLRGIATSLVTPEWLAAARGAFALSLSERLRGELGADLAWVREERSGFHARPLAGIAAGGTLPGPWGTLLQFQVGYPLVAPGPRSPTFELFLLRPLS